MSTSGRIIDRLKSSIQGDEATLELARRGPIPDHQVRGSSKPTRYHLMGGAGRVSGRLPPRRGTLSARDDPRVLEGPLNGSRPGMSSSSARCPNWSLKERTKTSESRLPIKREGQSTKR